MKTAEKEHLFILKRCLQIPYIIKVQIGIFECTGIMGQDLLYPYTQSTTILCDTLLQHAQYTHWVPPT